MHYIYRIKDFKSNNASSVYLGLGPSNGLLSSVLYVESLESHLVFLVNRNSRGHLFLVS